MPDTELPQMPAADLAQRLDGGEHVQVLDIRSPERVAQGRVAFGATLDFRALAASEMYRLPSLDRKSTRLNSSHTVISYAVFCLKKKKKKKKHKVNKKENTNS